jgi:hypothetical protein
LAHITAIGDDSRSHLETIAGSRIRVETPRVLVRATPSGHEYSFEQDSLRQQDDTETEDSTTTAETVEARGPIVGVAYNEWGACLNIEQIMSGKAKCLPDAPKDWKKLEKGN